MPTLQIPGLYHLSTEPDRLTTLFTRIDQHGGWPLDYKFLIVRHTVERERPLYFSTVPIDNEHNTTIYTADDYHWWKLTPEAKALHRARYRRELLSEIQHMVQK